VRNEPVAQRTVNIKHTIQHSTNTTLRNMKLILVCYMNKATDDEKDSAVAREH